MHRNSRANIYLNSQIVLYETLFDELIQKTLYLKCSKNISKPLEVLFPEKWLRNTASSAVSLDHSYQGNLANSLGMFQ